MTTSKKKTKFSKRSKQPVKITIKTPSNSKKKSSMKSSSSKIVSKPRNRRPKRPASSFINNTVDAVGKALDGKWGSAIKTLITGHGSYNMNELIANHPHLSSRGVGQRDDYHKIARGMPHFESTGEAGEQIFAFAEMVGNITSSTGFTVNNFPINVGNPELFSIGSRQASIYEQFEWSGLMFHFRSLCSNTSTTMGLGEIAMVTDYEPTLANNYTSIRDMANKTGVNTGPPTDNILHAVEVKRGMNPLSTYYVSHANDLERDPAFTNLGTFSYAVSGCPANGQNIGELWVIYKVKFKKIEPSQSIGDSALFARTSNVITYGDTVTSKSYFNFPYGTNDVQYKHIILSTYKNQYFEIKNRYDANPNDNCSFELVSKNPPPLGTIIHLSMKRMIRKTTGTQTITAATQASDLSNGVAPYNWNGTDATTTIINRNYTLNMDITANSGLEAVYIYSNTMVVNTIMEPGTVIFWPGYTTVDYAAAENFAINAVEYWAVTFSPPVVYTLPQLHTIPSVNKFLYSSMDKKEFFKTVYPDPPPKTQFRISFAGTSTDDGDARTSDGLTIMEIGPNFKEPVQNMKNRQKVISKNPVILDHLVTTLKDVVDQQKKEIVEKDQLIAQLSTTTIDTSSDEEEEKTVQTVKTTIGWNPFNSSTAEPSKTKRSASQK